MGRVAGGLWRGRTRQSGRSKGIRRIQRARSKVWPEIADQSIGATYWRYRNGDEALINMYKCNYNEGIYVSKYISCVSVVSAFVWFYRLIRLPEEKWKIQNLLKEINYIQRCIQPTIEILTQPGRQKIPKTLFLYYIIPTQLRHPNNTEMVPSSGKSPFTSEKYESLMQITLTMQRAVISRFLSRTSLR